MRIPAPVWIALISLMARLWYWTGVWPYFLGYDSFHYLFYPIIQGWRMPIGMAFAQAMRVFGDGLWLHAIVWGQTLIKLVAIVVFYHTILRVTGRKWLAFGAAVFLGALPLEASYDRLVMTESLLISFTIFLMHAVVRYLDRPSAWRGVAVGVWLTLLVMLHFRGLLFIPITLALFIGRWMFVRGEGRAVLGGLLGIMLVGLAVFVHRMALPAYADTAEVFRQSNLPVVLIRGGNYYNPGRPDVNAAVSRWRAANPNIIDLTWQINRFQQELSTSYFDGDWRLASEHWIETWRLNFSGYLQFVLWDMWALRSLPVNRIPPEFPCEFYGVCICFTHIWYRLPEWRWRCQEAWRTGQWPDRANFTVANRNYPPIRMWHIYILVLFEFALFMVRLARRRDRIAYAEVWVASSLAAVVLLGFAASWNLRYDGVRLVAQATPLALFLIAKNISRLFEWARVNSNGGGLNRLTTRLESVKN